MRRLEMEYFNTYYFCSLIQYLIEDAGTEYAKTLSEFTDPISELERVDFSKESYLHIFVGFVVERVLFEQNEYMANDIESAIEKDGYWKVVADFMSCHQTALMSCL